MINHRKNRATNSSNYPSKSRLKGKSKTPHPTNLSSAAKAMEVSQTTSSHSYPLKILILPKSL